MLNISNVSREQVAALWCAVIVVISAGAVIAGAGVTAGNGILALVAFAAPPVLMLFIWRPAPPTVAELLYDAHTNDKGDRR